MEQADFALVYVVCSGVEEARTIARKVLERRLAACANIVPVIHSLYWWEGRLEESQETILILKAPYNYYEEVEKVVKSHHSYRVPAILGIPIAKGLPDYLRWLAAETEFDY